MKRKFKNRVWKYATVVVVVLIILNPEMISLALFIDAVGLELFLMLLEVQIVAILAAFLNTKIMPIIAYIRSIHGHQYLIDLWRNIKEKPENFMCMAYSQAALMHLLVFSAAINILSLSM